jgi:sugar-specific transcriptional regulator TrmB
MTFIAALIAALVAVTGYMLTQAQARRERRAREFAEALAAVEEYLEAPYRIRRRQSATPEARDALTNALSDLQARIARHRAWLYVEAPAVARAYDALVAAARSEAGVQMTVAWNTAPPSSDSEMNLNVAYLHPKSDAERDRIIAIMRHDLRFWSPLTALSLGKPKDTGQGALSE